MNLLQQLSESKLTKEEIEAVIDICQHAVKMYKKNIDNLDKVIALYEQSGESGVIRLTIESDDGFETKNKSIEDVKVYRDEIINNNETEISHLGEAAKKLKELTKIFE